ncbi:activator of HSP90 ATPase [Chitinimonas prasina]|uniref:Activator of HSP90 ATPase n=1 Tax=Chitinimonas prasina TaxID=1434937 RepID=A0ABQ5YKN9_9NEIS|nr:SRPBCC family protein [Chitinimonas prasina]GLR13831.1 activator of HSP90 ATPase [Chitinimonas prasina]
MTATPWAPDPKLDLVLEREIDVPRELVWAAWTQAEHIPHWFTPAPWTVSHCEIDLRPGGMFSTTMRSPEGQDYPNIGCYLEVVPCQRLVWTDALLPGYRPAAEPFMSAMLLLDELPGGRTRYRAVAIHRDEAGRQRHEEMGFHQGWGTALDQLVAYAKQM